MYKFLFAALSLIIFFVISGDGKAESLNKDGAIFLIPMDENMDNGHRAGGLIGANYLLRYEIRIAVDSAEWKIEWCNEYAYFDTTEKFGFLCEIYGPNSINFLGLTPKHATLEDVLRWDFEIAGFDLNDKVIRFDRAVLANGVIEYRPYLEWRDRGKWHTGNRLYYSFIPIEVGPLKDDWYLTITTAYPEGSAGDIELSGDHISVRSFLNVH